MAEDEQKTKRKSMFDEITFLSDLDQEVRLSISTVNNYYPMVKLIEAFHDGLMVDDSSDGVALIPHSGITAIHIARDK